MKITYLRNRAFLLMFSSCYQVSAGNRLGEVEKDTNPGHRSERAGKRGREEVLNPVGVRKARSDRTRERDSLSLSAMLFRSWLEIRGTEEIEKTRSYGYLKSSE